MKTFKIYKARLNYNQNKQYLFNIEAENLDSAKLILKTKYNFNPFYFVFIDSITENVIYNNHLPI